MKTKLIIIVTIILTAINFVVFGAVILSADDNVDAKTSSPFPQPEIFRQHYQPANQPSPNPLFDQAVNYQLPYDPFIHSGTGDSLLPNQSSRESESVEQPIINYEVPVSFAATHRKVTGPIIYDVGVGDDVGVGVVSGCEPVCAPVCEPVCAPVGVPAFDDIGCYDGVASVPVWYSRVKFYGWLQGGLYANSHGSTTQRFHGINRRGQNDLLQRAAGGNGASLGNVRQTGAVLNQLWFGLSRELDLCSGFDWGFRGEFLFGTDAWLTQSYGDATFDYWTIRRDYGISIPQLYVTLGYRNLSVKIGKFESLLGFEHIQAVDSPFYSHSNLFYAEPQSHSGVLFDYNVNPDFWFSLGYVQGADSTLSNRFGDNGLIGGIYWRCCPSMTVWYTIYFAKSAAGVFANGEPHAAGDLFRHTLVLNWKLTSRLDYAFQWDLGNRVGRRSNNGNASYFGWAQYFTYKIHSRLNGGIRIDQLHSNKLMATSGFARPNTGNFVGNLYGVTIGLEWKPYQNFSFKPELRYDYSDTKGTFGKGNHRDQISFGFGIVYDF
ncbi:MAG: porin [Planctomycetaceae bacterium]|jgi:hypothetical protein|nr:porin [Planctomycetaceae bacterium]